MTDIIAPEGKELVLFEKLDPIALFKPNGCDSLIAEIKKFVGTVDRDASTAEGRENIKSLAFRVTKTKTGLEKIGKALVDEAKKQVKQVDAERIRAVEALDAYAAEVRQPLTEWENRDLERVAKHEAELLSLEVQAVFAPNPTAAEVQARLDGMKQFDGMDWEEFTARAKLVTEATMTKLTALLAERQKAEKDAAELEQLRAEKAAQAKKDEEERIATAARLEAEKKAAEAAEKARLEAEATIAAAEKAAAEAKAAREAAERKAAEDAKAAVLAAEQAEQRRLADLKAAEDKAAADAKAAADRAEAEKKAAVEAEQKRAAEAKAAEEAAAKKREADKAHRQKINREALDAVTKAASIGDFTIPEASAKAIVTAIANGQIPHIKIEY